MIIFLIRGEKVKKKYCVMATMMTAAMAAASAMMWAKSNPKKAKKLKKDIREVTDDMEECIENMM